MDIKNSSIELLKILAIVLVIFSHIIPFGYQSYGYEYIDLNYASTNLQNIALQIIRYGGQVGNIIFILCSSWFLIDKVKIDYKKTIIIIINSFIISIICMILVLLLKYQINIKTILKQFFPIMFANNWFIGCYIIFYLISPWINCIINKMTQKELKITIVTMCFFNFIEIIKENNYIYNYLIGFIIIYFIVSYIKKYNKNFEKMYKYNCWIMFLSIFLLIISIIIFNIIGMKYTFFINKMQKFNNIKNPLVFLIGLSIFNFFYNKKINNKIINFIASQSLIIYLFHDNYLVRNYLRKDWFIYVYNNLGYSNIVCLCVLSSIFVFIISVFFATMYKKIIEKPLLKLIKIGEQNEKKKCFKKLFL